jgi:hypothetical protein
MTKRCVRRVCLALCVAAATAISITFTGDVRVDFPDVPGVLINVDGGLPVRHPARNTDSGWNIVDIRYSYDQATDMAFFGGCPKPKLRRATVPRHAFAPPCACAVRPQATFVDLCAVFLRWQCSPPSPPAPFLSPALTFHPTPTPSLDFAERVSRMVLRRCDVQASIRVIA